MTSLFAKRGRLALAVAATILVGSACAMTAVFAHPMREPDAVMGAGWQCQQFVWLTSCTRVQSDAPAVQNGRRDAVELGRV